MNQHYLMRILQSPIVSEKSTTVADNHKQFVFKVLNAATKRQIKASVELMFNVQVDSVNVLNIKGKTKRFGRFVGKRSDWKKAYVTLKPGFDIDLSTA
jgi:large subunit ribosomal protein L23